MNSRQQTPITAKKIVSCLFFYENGKYNTVIKYINILGEEITLSWTTDSHTSFYSDIQFFKNKIQ